MSFVETIQSPFINILEERRVEVGKIHIVVTPFCDLTRNWFDCIFFSRVLSETSLFEVPPIFKFLKCLRVQNSESKYLLE